MTALVLPRLLIKLSTWWSRGLAGGAKKGEFRHRGANLVPHGLHSQFHLELSARLGVFALDAREGNHPLEKRRPSGGGCLAHLRTSFVDGHGHARGGARHL